MNDQERDERITEMHTDVKWLKKIMGNHLQHHQKLLFWVLGITSTIIIALLLAIVAK